MAPRTLAFCACLCVVLAACVVDRLKPATPGPPPQANRIAVVDTAGDVVTVAPDGRDPRKLTDRGSPDGSGNRSVHFWPSWSPDGRWIAAARVDLIGDEPNATALYALPAGGGEPRALLSSADYLPFYYVWAPDSRSIAILSQSGEGLTLHVGGLDTRAERRAAAQHSLYFAWSADSRRLATHVDGAIQAEQTAALSLLPADGSPPTALAARPSSFRSPAFAPDGSSVIAGGTTADAHHALQASPVDGGPPRTLLRLDNPPEFVVSPRGDRLAVARESELMPGSLYDLDVVDLGSGSTTRWQDGMVFAFFWSPDGTRLAWIALDPMAFELVWYVADGPGKARKLVSFTPSELFEETLEFFDAYAPTGGVWSPDSRSIVFAGWLDAEHVGPSQVWVVPVDGGAPHVAGEGVMASWSPR